MQFTEAISFPLTSIWHAHPLPLDPPPYPIVPFYTRFFNQYYLIILSYHYIYLTTHCTYESYYSILRFYLFIYLTSNLIFFHYFVFSLSSYHEACVSDDESVNALLDDFIARNCGYFNCTYDCY